VKLLLQSSYFSPPENALVGWRRGSSDFFTCGLGEVKGGLRDLEVDTGLVMSYRLSLLDGAFSRGRGLIIFSSPFCPPLSRHAAGD